MTLRGLHTKTMSNLEKKKIMQLVRLAERASILLHLLTNGLACTKITESQHIDRMFLKCKDCSIKQVLVVVYECTNVRLLTYCVQLGSVIVWPLSQNTDIAGITIERQKTEPHLWTRGLCLITSVDMDWTEHQVFTVCVCLGTLTTDWTMPPCSPLTSCLTGLITVGLDWSHFHFHPMQHNFFFFW